MEHSQHCQDHTHNCERMMKVETTLEVTTNRLNNHINESVEVRDMVKKHDDTIDRWSQNIHIFKVAVIGQLVIGVFMVIGIFMKIHN